MKKLILLIIISVFGWYSSPCHAVDIWLDVDTAVAIPVNKLPLVDATDGKTIEAAIVYNEAGMDLSWTFVTCAGVTTTTAVTPTTGGVHDWTESGTDEGMYLMEIPASAGTVNNDTEGFGWWHGTTTTCLPFCSPVYGFRHANKNDLEVEDGTAGTNQDDMYDGTGYAGGTVRQIVDAESANGNDFPCLTEQLVSDGAAAPANFASLAILATGEVGIDLDNTQGTLDAGEIGTGAITSTKFASAAITATTFAANAITDAAVADDLTLSATGMTNLVEGAGYLGDSRAGKTIYFLWRTYDGSGEAANPSAAGTVKIYADDSATEITAPTGITDTRGFDSTTGLHLCKIDLSANTTFYQKKKDYSVVLSGATIDSRTVNAVLATFSIENRFTEKQFIPR